MGEITRLVEFFFLSVALGMGFFSFIASPKLTGAGFQRLVCGVCLGTMSGGFLIHLLGGGTFIGLASLLYLIPLITATLTHKLHPDYKTPFMWVLYFIQNTALTYLVYLKTAPHFSFALTSVLFLGIITYSMILGHYYLVVPKLSERPLKVSLRILWCVFTVKVVWTTITYFNSADFFEMGTSLGGGFSFNWMMLAMRSIWGYLVIIIMSLFTWRLVCMRSIQSATGVLYAMTFFVFIGEMVSGYLLFQYGILL